jgi:hypothetical protein
VRVIIAGSRDFRDYQLLDSFLSYCGLNITEVVCGEARGADTLGKQWALDNDIPLKLFPAKWESFGKSAGYRRNLIMAENADALVAFWDGESQGTKHMLDIAEEKT